MSVCGSMIEVHIKCVCDIVSVLQDVTAELQGTKEHINR